MPARSSKASGSTQPTTTPASHVQATAEYARKEHVQTASPDTGLVPACVRLAQDRALFTATPTAERLSPAKLDSSSSAACVSKYAGPAPLDRARAVRLAT